MKKILILMLLLALPVQGLCFDYDTGYELGTGCTDNFGSAGLYYGSLASASAACYAFWTEFGGQSQSCSIANTDLGPETNYFVVVSPPGTYFIYGTCSVPAEVEDPDEDEDGIPDEIDPFEDDRDFTWTTVVIKRDSNGDICYRLVEITDSNSREVSYMGIGDASCSGDDYIEILQDPIKTQDSYKALFGTYTGEGGISPNDPEDLTGNTSSVEILPSERTEDPSGDMVTGNQADPADTDTQKLSKITNNIYGLNENAKTQADQINETNNLLRQQIDLKQTELKKDIEDARDAQDAATSAGNYDPSITLEAIDQDDIDGTGLNDTDIDQETWFSNFISNNPINEAIDSTEIQTSSAASSVCFSFKGQNICFDLLPWQSTLNMIGTLLLGLSGITAIVVLVRG